MKLQKPRNNGEPRPFGSLALT